MVNTKQFPAQTYEYFCLFSTRPLCLWPLDIWAPWLDTARDQNRPHDERFWCPRREDVNSDSHKIYCFPALFRPHVLTWLGNGVMILQLHFSLLSPNPDGPTRRAKEQMIDVPPPLFLSPIIKSASFHNAERREKYSISLASVPSVRRRRRRRTKSGERERESSIQMTT